jgi:predicted dienelactone hydrolase
VTYTPFLRATDGRMPLELRLPVPATGNNLPIVLLSHGI